MPLASVLKQLRRRMASLQSQRTQCCCCAVGVFAAMFGIFMLSAGICIVVNVTFMEVDTSGLPSHLRNDSGKKVVGIILICVAIAALGLSATVSIVYFALCNRKPRTSTFNSQQQQQQQHGHGGVGSSTMGMNQEHNSPALSNKAVDRLRHGERPRSHESVRSAGASTSVKSKRSSTHSGDNLPSLSSSWRGLPPSSGSKAHGHSPAHHKRHKKRHLRPGRYRTELPTHTEEDPESAKSVADLKMFHKSGETYSSSGSSMAPSQNGILTGGEPPPTEAESYSFSRDAAAMEAAEMDSPLRRSLPRRIMTDDYPGRVASPMSTVSSTDDFLEYTCTEHATKSSDHNFVGSDSEFTASGKCLTPVMDVSISGLSSGVDSNALCKQQTSTSEHVAATSLSSRENSDLVSQSSSLSPSVKTIQVEENSDNLSLNVPINDFDLPQLPSDPPVPHVIEGEHPENGVFLDQQRPFSDTALMSYKYQLDGGEQLQQEGEDADDDSLPELRSAWKDQQLQQHNKEELEPDSRCESQCSNNSAFSYEGEDPDLVDRKRVEERMKALLK